MARPRILINPALRYHGKPCKLGHTERYRSNNNCVECLRVQAASRRPKTGPGVQKSQVKNHPDRPKLCPQCNTVKEPSEYWLSRSGTLTTYCKECSKETMRIMRKLKYNENRRMKKLGKPINSVIR